MAGLTIQQVAERTGLTGHTLRYYERAGLLAPVGRAANGHRRYADGDVATIRFLAHLRRAGMPIAAIQRYMALARAGDATVAERLAILEDHQRAVERRIEELRAHLAVIDAKVAHYRDQHRPRLARRA